MNRNYKIKLKCLNKIDECQLKDLIKVIEETIDDKRFWLPITDISRKYYLDEKWTRFVGVFDKGKLVATFRIFFNKKEYGESQWKLELTKFKCVELGGAIVYQNIETKA